MFWFAQTVSEFVVVTADLFHSKKAALKKGAARSGSESYWTAILPMILPACWVKLYVSICERAHPLVSFLWWY